MKRCIAVAVLLVAGFCGGCTQEAPTGYRSALTPDAGITTAFRCTDPAEGSFVGSDADTIEGEMLLKVYGPDGAPYVTNVTFTMDLRGGRIEASAPTGDGRWTACVDTLGRGRFDSRTPLGQGVSPECLKASLGDVLHRMRGAANILAGSEEALGRSEDRIDGTAVDCITVRPTESRIRRYCFEKGTGRLRFAEAGRQSDDRDGTVTVYDDYTRHIRGIALPMHLRMVEVGEYVLLGETRIWDAQFLSVTMN